MRRLVVLASALAALALAGCGGDPAPSDADGGTSTSTPSPDGGPGNGGGDGGDGGNGGGGGGDGCAVISASQVSEILGEAYVEAPTGIAGIGPDGSYTEEGISGYACLFSPADGDIHDLSITTFTDAADMYNDLAEGDPIDGVGQRAQLFRDEIEVMVIAEGTNHTVATVILTSLDGSSVEDQVIEITRIVLSAA